MNLLLSTKQKGLGWILCLSAILGMSMYLLPTMTNLKIVVGFAALCLIFWKVELGLYGAVIAMPFLTFKYISLLIFYTFGCYILKKLYKKQPLAVTTIDGPLFMFFLVLVFSALFSVTFSQSLKELFVYTSILLMVFMVSRDLDKKALNTLLMCLVITAAIVALYGIYQYSTGEMGGHGWVDVKTNPNLKARAYSTMENPNILAEYLVIACSMSVALFLDSRNRLRKLLLLLTSAITSLGLLLTLSRGGWIAFALALFLIIVSENKKLLPIGIILGLCSLYFLPEVFIDRLKTIGSLKDSSNAYRFSIWAAALRMLKDFWPSGVGLGYEAFMKVYPNYMLAGIKAAHAHNSYLQIAIETGIFGLLAFLYNIIKVYTTGIMVVLKSSQSFQRRISIAALGAITGLLFHGFVEHILFDYRVIFSFWLMIAIVLATYRQTQNAAE